ncbi:phosphotransferase [Nostocoides sp. F2B08]|uniref:phosphotransferase family protein n=1 Tax=Nostocoides sp. F2B08 TaxID=2653936 RepID=UPI001263C568|nr:phosphotransferase family protein [Tetrasphaera sp. F2B08]KAB7743481.1 phosphotransferase [Tetrasphaera sp. F2B08]
MSDRDLPGADLGALATWLREQHPGVVEGDLHGTLVPGGKSNLTYIVSDGAGREVVLRRPPLGHVLATAHDMGRESRVMSALAGSAVPVPQVLAVCADESVLGAPFYVMSKATGAAYRTKEELDELGTERTAAIIERLMTVLADLHSIDPEDVALGDFGRPEGFLARQVQRWRKQFDASRSRDLPGEIALFEALAEHVPDQGPTGIVHGDYRLDNCLVDVTLPGDPLTAVLDWEMSTIGDPLTDLALLLVYSDLGRDPAWSAAVTTAPLAAGYPSNEQLIERYASVSDRDLSHLSWYIALANYKLAGVMEGIHYRFVQGKTVGAGFEHAGGGVYMLLENGLAALRR